jgi:hypothetical protein
MRKVCKIASKSYEVASFGILYLCVCKWLNLLSVLPDKYLAALKRTAVTETCADYKGVLQNPLNILYITSFCLIKPISTLESLGSVCKVFEFITYYICLQISKLSLFCFYTFHCRQSKLVSHI